jgi:hypothetical protein
MRPKGSTRPYRSRIEKKIQANKLICDTPQNLDSQRDRNIVVIDNGALPRKDAP